MTEGAWIEGNTVHIVIDSGDLAIHREGVAALDADIKGARIDGVGVTKVGENARWRPLVHFCEACGAPATRSVALNPEGEERVWFCEGCE